MVTGRALGSQCLRGATLALEDLGMCTTRRAFSSRVCQEVRSPSEQDQNARSPGASRSRRLLFSQVEHDTAVRQSQLVDDTEVFGEGLAERGLGNMRVDCLAAT